jgi:prefoldin subunit 5
VKDRLAGIDANLDDLQAGIEACARTAEALHTDAAKYHKILKQIKNAPFIRSLMKRLGELEMFAHDQEGTLQELREHIDRLQDGLRAGSFEVRSPRVAAAADRRRRGR